MKVQHVAVFRLLCRQGSRLIEPKLSGVLKYRCYCCCYCCQQCRSFWTGKAQETQASSRRHSEQNNTAAAVVTGKDGLEERIYPGTVVCICGGCKIKFCLTGVASSASQQMRVMMRSDCVLDTSALALGGSDADRASHTAAVPTAVQYIQYNTTPRVQAAPAQSIIRASGRQAIYSDGLCVAQIMREMNLPDMGARQCCCCLQVKLHLIMSRSHISRQIEQFPYGY